MGDRTALDRLERLAAIQALQAKVGDAALAEALRREAEAKGEEARLATRASGAFDDWRACVGEGVFDPHLAAIGAARLLRCDEERDAAAGAARATAQAAERSAEIKRRQDGEARMAEALAGRLRRRLRHSRAERALEEACDRTTARWRQT